MKKLLEDIKKATVFLGIIEKGKYNFIATGFLIEINNIFHLVTARHVVFDSKNGKFVDENLFIFFNNKEGKIVFRKISDIKQKFKVNWVIDKTKIDIALIPFGLNPETDDVKVIPEKLFLPIESIRELYNVFFASFQPGVQLSKIDPILRRGVISKINEDGSFYIDGFAYPGNSGSPVFLMPSPIRFNEDGRINIGGDVLGGKFIGVIGEYIPYQEIAISIQTKRPRVVFEENTGLSRVWSIDCLKKIIDSEKFKIQINRLKNSEKNIRVD